MDENTARVPLPSNLNIREFGGANISQCPSKMVNCSLRKKWVGGQEHIYVSQRPGITLLHDASGTVSDAKGRGVYYWDATDAEYFVNNNTVYKNSYGTVLGTITAGSRKCTFVEIGSHLVLLDPENDEGWYITTGDALTQITDGDFPSTLADGGAQLDGYLFVMDETGLIYHSDSDDATSWNALSFIDAERENDGGAYLAKMTDHIVAMGKQTIEFFQDVGNPTGSVLSRRQDLSYNIGCVDGETVWRNADFIYFIGVDDRGSLGVYMMSGLQIKKVSNADLDSFITENRFSESTNIIGSGFSAFGTNYYFITFYTEDASGNQTSSLTLVFEESSAMWHIWNTALDAFDGILGLPLIDWTTRSGVSNRYGEGIMANGDIITFSSFPTAYDSSTSAQYIADDYWVDGYVLDSTGGTDLIEMLIRMGEMDFGINGNKFLRSLEFVGPRPYNNQFISVRWSDGSTESYGDDRTIDLGGRRKISGLGKFNRRHFEFEMTDVSEPVYLEAVEFTIDRGSI